MTKNPSLYYIKRDGARWALVSPAGVVMFSSLRRINCKDFAESNNYPLKEPEDKPQEAP